MESIKLRGDQPASPEPEVLPQEPQILPEREKEPSLPDKSPWKRPKHVPFPSTKPKA